MGYNEFKYLIDKFKTGNCTLNELEELEAQMQKETEVKEWMMDAMKNQVVSEPGINVHYDQLFQKIKKQISEPVARKKKPIGKLDLMFPLKWAALIALAFIIGGLVSYVVFTKAFLSGNNSYSEVIAPMGSRTEMNLPDGSKVWLNAGTKLRYTDNFNKSNRDLVLEGEAYFQIEKNEKLPLIVNALGVKVKVVGTTFNVKAYPSENAISTTLVEGKVILESEKYNFGNDIILLPNQKAVFLKTDQELAITTIDDLYSEISWKDNQLIIKGEELSELAVKLERKYNVKIAFDSEDIKTYKFSGTLEDETLQQVLDVIKVSAPIKYQIKGRNIVLTLDTGNINSYNKLLKNSNN